LYSFKWLNLNNLLNTKILKTIMLLNYLTWPVLFKGQPSSSIHQFKCTTLTGKEFNFEALTGKKILIVNTASKCGLTPQYKELQALHEEYKDKGLVIIGFPCNDFAKQEPGGNKEIESFCEINYGVTFLMMEKISVKGDSIHPIYAWLTSKLKNGVMNSTVKWNFQKYLLNEKGELVDVVTPWKSPKCKKILRWLAH
jgi:glutathione peroxidase